MTLREDLFCVLCAEFSFSFVLLLRCDDAVVNTGLAYYVRCAATMSFHVCVYLSSYLIVLSLCTLKSLSLTASYTMLYLSAKKSFFFHFTTFRLLLLRVNKAGLAPCVSLCICCLHNLKSSELPTLHIVVDLSVLWTALSLSLIFTFSFPFPPVLLNTFCVEHCPRSTHTHAQIYIYIYISSKFKFCVLATEELVCSGEDNTRQALSCFNRTIAFT